MKITIGGQWEINFTPTQLTAELEEVIKETARLTAELDKKDQTMATQEEAVAALTKVNETLVKVSNETDSLLEDIDKLAQALEDAQEAGGAITPELEAAIKATAARTHAIGELVADVPQPEKEA